MAYTDDQKWILAQAGKESTLSFENQSSEKVAANVAAKALAAAAERLPDTGLAAQPPTRLTKIDGVDTIVARAPLVTGNVAQQVSGEELEAMGGQVEHWPDCALKAVGRCDSPKGAGRYQIFGSTGRPMSINADGEIVYGDVKPILEHSMSRADRSRAELAGIGIGGGNFAPSGQVGQMVVQAKLDVCLVHSFGLPVARPKPKIRYITGPYPGIWSAKRRAHTVHTRTRENPTVFDRKVNGSEAWYVKGDDGMPGYKGTIEEMI